MAAAIVASQQPPTFSPSSPSEIRKKLSPTNGSRANQKPMSTPASASKPTTKPAPIPRGKRERPCDACRRRKSKCVVNEGTKVCAACGVHGQECTYVEDPQPRKRKVDSDGQGLDSSKRRSQASPISDISSTPSSNRQDTQSQTTRTSAPVIPRPIVAPIHVQQETDQYSGLHVGPTTELEPLLLSLSTNHTAWLNDMYKTKGKTPFLIDRVAEERSKSAAMAAQQTLASLIGPHGPRFIQTYLTNIHSSFPILPISLLTSASTSIPPVLLSSIFASTIPYFPSSIPIDLNAVETLAFTLFTDSLPSPTLATVQAGVLLMQRPGIDTRTLNSQLVSAACDLGLQVDCSGWGLSTQEASLRKRLAWAVYVQDKWTALVHGRPSCIREEEWAVEPLATDDFEQSVHSSTTQEDAQRDTEAFIELVNLSKILATVLDTFYTLRAMNEVSQAGARGVRLILDRAKPVQLRLKEWFSGLTGSCKLDSATTSATSVSSQNTSGAVAWLHLAYFATEITIHRCIIRSLHSPSPSKPNSSVPTPPVSAPSTSDLPTSTSSAEPMLTHICRAAAKTRLISAMDFINRLRPAQYRGMATFFPAPTCFSLVASFGALLRATSPSREEEEFYAHRMNEFRWTLGVSARGMRGPSPAMSLASDGSSSASRILDSENSGGGAEWLAQAISWVDAWEEVCAGLAENKPSIGGNTGEDDAGAYQDTGRGKQADRMEEMGIEEVQAVRFAQIGEGEIGLASPSMSSETGESFEAWAGAGTAAGAGTGVG